MFGGKSETGFLTVYGGSVGISLNNDGLNGHYLTRSTSSYGIWWSIFKPRLSSLPSLLPCRMSTRVCFHQASFIRSVKWTQIADIANDHKPAALRLDAQRELTRIVPRNFLAFIPRAVVLSAVSETYRRRTRNLVRWREKPLPQVRFRLLVGFHVASEKLAASFALVGLDIDATASSSSRYYDYPHRVSHHRDLVRVSSQNLPLRRHWGKRDSA